MRYTVAITLALALLQPLGDAQSLSIASQSSTGQSDGPKPNIQLTIRVTKQISCKGDRDAYTEVFDVATRYLNKGTKDLTIYTGEDYSPNEKVANTLADMKTEKYVSDSNWDVFFTDDGEHTIGDRPRPEPPRTLSPGQAAESESSFGLVMRRKGTVVPMSILPGTYYVRLGVMTKIAKGRSSSDREANPTKANGFHWTFVLSEPIRVELSETPVLQDCDELFKKEQH
jgi:hypothetical protein